MKSLRAGVSSSAGIRAPLPPARREITMPAASRYTSCCGFLCCDCSAVLGDGHMRLKVLVVSRYVYGLTVRRPPPIPVRRHAAEQEGPKSIELACPYAKGGYGRCNECSDDIATLHPPGELPVGSLGKSGSVRVAQFERHHSVDREGHLTSSISGRARRRQGESTNSRCARSAACASSATIA